MEANYITTDMDMDGMCEHLVVTNNTEISGQDTERPREKDVNRESGNSVVIGNTEILDQDTEKPVKTDLDGASVNLFVTGNTEITDQDMESWKEIDMDGTSVNLPMIVAAEMPDQDTEKPGEINADGTSGDLVMIGNTEMSAQEKIGQNKFNMGRTFGNLVLSGSSVMQECDKKRPGEMPSDSRHLNKKSKKDVRMQEALSDIADAVKKLMNKREKINDKSIEKALNALQAMPDIDEELVMDACDLLEDERKAKTFLALNVSLRKKWLLRKLRS